jgi:hypothetical protein
MAKGWRELKEENVLGICESMLRNHAPAEVRTVRKLEFAAFPYGEGASSHGSCATSLACQNR